MGILQAINLRVFLLSFVVGLLVLYYVMPQEEMIYVYPTPENVDLIQYKDRADNCYAVRKEEVTCPSESEISHIPVQ
jgi:hypothetical protein